jgi:hypothetical protein
MMGHVGRPDLFLRRVEAVDVLVTMVMRMREGFLSQHYMTLPQNVLLTVLKPRPWQARVDHQVYHIHGSGIGVSAHPAAF